MDKNSISTVRVEALKRFIDVCEAEKLGPEFILSQIKLFCEGVRGLDMHDSAIMLIDGEVQILM